MTEEEFQNILIIAYFLVEQGKLKNALHVLSLAAEFYTDNIEFNRMLLTIFYMQKDYKKCALLFRKHPSLSQGSTLFKQIQKICQKIGGTNSAGV